MASPRLRASSARRRTTAASSPRATANASRPSARFEPDIARRDNLARRFFAAVSEGNVGALVQMVSEDAVVYGDGGGKAPQWSTPIVGRDRVAQLLAGVGTRVRDVGGQLVPHQINRQPGVMLLDAEQRMISVFSVDIAGGVVRALHSVINPDKLRHLGPVERGRGEVRVRVLASSVQYTDVLVQLR